MYKRLLTLFAIVIAVQFFILSAAMADRATITLQPGQNWISLPLVPFDPDPTHVFAGLDINHNLTGFDAYTKKEVAYDHSKPDIFFGMLLGEGYTIWNHGTTPITISYEGAPDGLPDYSGLMTDMWISIPYVGETWVGMPFNHNVLFSDIYYTDGTYTIDVNSAVRKGWIDGLWTTWDALTQETTTVGLNSLNPDDIILRPGQMYKVISHKNNLAVIIPAYPLPEPTSISALLVGISAFVGLALQSKRQGLHR